jgi:hypothetical protein
MTEAITLMEQAARCRRIARLCTTPAIARKFEALARDYEEHARLLRKTHAIADGDRAVEPCEPGTVHPTPP